MTFEERDPSGRISRRFSLRNAFTDAYADILAQALAAYANPVPSVPVSHIGLGTGGATISDCESATGWAAAPTLDAATYTTGTASLKASQGASTTGTYANPTLIAAYDASASGTSIEVAMRLAARGTFDLAASRLRIYTGGSTANYYEVSFAGIETAVGSTFQDGTWKVAARIPITSFTAIGSPSWAQVTGAGFVVTANGTGTATLNFDDLRVYPPSISALATQTATSVANEKSKQALSTLSFTSPGLVTASAYWSANELAGTFYIVGLYGNGGATLAAVLPLSYTKPPNYTLSVTWSVTMIGG
ncbi:MAG: hypothetical protein C0498_01290 [Anaerolinea sp.]|nr:hypothetical protein [Anaerolinea sp.]